MSLSNEKLYFKSKNSLGLNNISPTILEDFLSRVLFSGRSRFSSSLNTEAKFNENNSLPSLFVVLNSLPIVMEWPPNKAWTSTTLRQGFRHFVAINYGGTDKDRWVSLVSVLDANSRFRVSWDEMKDVTKIVW